MESTVNNDGRSCEGHDTSIIDSRRLLLKSDRPLAKDFVGCLLENYTYGKVEVSVDAIQLSFDRLSAVVELNYDVDAVATQKTIDEKNKLDQKITVENLPINRKIIVRHLSPDRQQDDIELYFESKRKCPIGGAVTNIELHRQKHCAVVEFEDPCTVNRVVGASHPMLGDKATVESWSPVASIDDNVKVDTVKPTSTRRGSTDLGAAAEKSPSSLAKIGPASIADRLVHTSLHAKLPDQVTAVQPRQGRNKQENQSVPGQNYSVEKTYVAVKNFDQLQVMKEFLFKGGLVRSFGCTATLDDQHLTVVLHCVNKKSDLHVLSQLAFCLANDELCHSELKIENGEIAEKLVTHGTSWVYEVLHEDIGTHIPIAFTFCNKRPVVMALEQNIADRGARLLMERLLCGTVSLTDGDKPYIVKSENFEQQWKRLIYELISDQFAVHVEKSDTKIVTTGVPSDVIKTVGHIHGLFQSPGRRETKL